MRIAQLLFFPVGLWSMAVGASDPGDILPGPGLRALVMNYANCVVGKKHDEVKSYLLAQPYTASKGDGKLPKDSGCFSVFHNYSEISFLSINYRYALANAVVRADFAESGPESFADRIALAQPPIPDRMQLIAALAATKDADKKCKMKNQYYKALEEASFTRVGECMARTEPVSSRQLLLTAPESPEEIGLGKVLQPVFELCRKQTPYVQSFRSEFIRGPLAWSFLLLANSAPKSAIGAQS